MKSDAGKSATDESHRKGDILRRKANERNKVKVRRNTNNFRTFESFCAPLPRGYARDGFESVVL